jgi:hypothetical protein
MALSVSLTGACILLSSSLLLATFVTFVLFDKMEDFQSETDSDYTSYWRDWVSSRIFLHWSLTFNLPPLPREKPPLPLTSHLT